MLKTITTEEYEDFVTRVNELLPNDNYHGLSLVGVSFYDQSDVSNGIVKPVAEVKYRKGGYYVILFDDVLIEDTDARHAFEILIEELEVISGADITEDPYEEFTRGGYP